LINAESHLIAQFRKHSSERLSPNELLRTRSVWGTLVLMQHYGAPTRLLDWSFSPWVAAFFSCAGHLDSDGIVWIANTKGLRELANEIPPEVGSPGFSPLVGATDLNEWRRVMDLGDEWLTFIHPSRTTARCSAQQSLFTISNVIDLDHRAWIGLGLNDPSQKLALIIPARLKRDLMRLFHSMNLTSNALFPDLSGASQAMREKLLARISTNGPVDDWAL